MVSVEECLWKWRCWLARLFAYMLTAAQCDMSSISNSKSDVKARASQTDEKQEKPVGLTFRVVAIAVVVMYLIALMTSRADIAKTMAGIGVTGVPSPAAILVVLLLMGMSELLRKSKIQVIAGLKRGELLLLYIIVSIGGLLTSSLFRRSTEQCKSLELESG